MNPTVLYVEDEETDALLMRMAFDKEGLSGVLQVVTDGQAAIDYLSATEDYADRARFPFPDAILLDLNLPEVHGFDVLQWIRSHPVHGSLAVVIFSSSSREEDQARACQLGANDFVQKPSSPALFRQIVRTLHDRWLVPKPSNSSSTSSDIKQAA